MTDAELEQSARIVEAELRKIREATGMREVSASAGTRDVYWYCVAGCGDYAIRDTFAEAINSFAIQQRKAAAK